MTAVAVAKHEPPELSFPPFRLDLVEERLWKGEVELRLRRKPFAILRYLAMNPRRLVTHAELVAAVWGGKIAMSESLIRTHVRDVRRVVGERLIETVVGRGYRFTADQAEVDDEGGSAIRPTLRLAQGTEAEAPSAPTAGSARILEALASALSDLGPNAKVLLIIGGTHTG